jgi:hypothetical protein
MLVMGFVMSLYLTNGLKGPVVRSSTRYDAVHSDMLMGCVTVVKVCAMA